MNIYMDIVGCTANQSDASIARYLLEKDPQYQIVESSNDASIILLFSCTVISATEQRILSKINKYHHQGKTVIVTGCMASIQQDLLAQVSTDIICILPTQIHQLLSYLPSLPTDAKITKKYDGKKRFNKIQAPIAISEGCDFSCAYCITTLARGNLQSVPISIIKRDIIEALHQGCKEIQLTAQDTASYGKDIGTNLASLLRVVQKISGWFRCRIGMMNPAMVLPQIENLIDCFGDPHFYKFLHLPIQSGDDTMLSLMNREYTTNDVFAIVQRFRNRYPHITLATDVIVGFPSETETQHQHTLKMLKHLHPDIINITKFSARPYTKAKKMQQRIPTDIVKKRSKELTNLSSKLSLEKNTYHIGKSYTILITEYGKQDTIMGRTDTYKPVILQESCNIGDVVDVTITNAYQTHLVGILK